MNDKTRLTVASAFLIIAIVILVTAIIGMATDYPSLKWAKSFIIPALLLTMAAGALRRRAGRGR